MVQGRPSNVTLRKKQSLALARQACLEARKPPFQLAVISPTPDPNNAENQDVENESSGDEIKCTGWSGGVTHCISDDEEPIFISDSDGEGEDEEVEVLSGSELEEAIQRHGEWSAGKATMRHTAAGTMMDEPPAMQKQPIAESVVLSITMDQRTNQEWRKMESTRSLGYNGQSARMKRHRAKVARDKETEDAKLRNG